MKPHVKGCGCWTWCETCKGAGEVILPNTYVRNANGSYGPSMTKCLECKGAPAKMKYCQTHAKEAGFGTDWRAKR